MRSIAVAAVVGVVGCGEPDEPAISVAPGEARPTTAPRPSNANTPAEPPDIKGIVTSVDERAVTIEQDPADESGSPKAAVRLHSETIVLYRGGELATAADLTIGHNVSAWFDGPVAESYPVQATAETIVIEPAGAP